MRIELIFPVLGEQIPTDHGYALYSSLSAVLPELHDGSLPVAVSSISGIYIGQGRKQLDRRSRLRLRVDLEQLPRLLPLSGKPLNIAGNKLRLGAPRVQALVAAPTLYARMVTIKGFTQPEPFLEAASRQLSQLGIEAELAIPAITSGDHAGKPSRRVLRIRGKRVIGFALLVQGLTVPASLALQERGVGGRRKMGSGFFMPTRNR